MLERHHSFASAHVAARPIDVWLPPGYADRPERRYPALYMQDGQNLFNPEDSYIGEHWAVSEAMTRLIEAGDAREAIIVGVWNSAARKQEYMPEKPYVDLEARNFAEVFLHKYEGKPTGDAYLHFLTEELKPFIDRTYRTAPQAADTYVMGSSLGGLTALYAVCERPDIFGGAACLSTHWPIGRRAAQAYFRRRMPVPGSHKLYFDYGDEARDYPHYLPYQTEIEAIARTAGYRDGIDLLVRAFEGHEHSEPAWRERVHIPLAFLLGDV